MLGLHYVCCNVGVAMLLLLCHVAYVGVDLCVLLMLGCVSVVQCICNLGVADMCWFCTVCVAAAVFCCLH